MGRAYAFFDCRTSAKRIKRELPTIRNMAKTPPPLELSLRRTRELAFRINIDPKLQALAHEAMLAENKYVLTGALSGASNKETAEQLVGIMMVAYSAPPLFERGEQFFCHVFYKDIPGSYIEHE